MFNFIAFGNPNAVGNFSAVRVHARNDAEYNPAAGSRAAASNGVAGQGAATQGAEAVQTDTYVSGDAALAVDAGVYTSSLAKQTVRDIGEHMYAPPETDLKGADNTGLRNYLDYGMGKGNTSLAALNASRKRLGDRINNVLAAAGIQLKSDEKISISVDGKNQFVVGGLKDKTKAKKIQQALNGDAKLGAELRKHVAAGTINRNAKAQEAYEKAGGTGAGNANAGDAYTNRPMRAFVIDEYLKENAGVSLSDLSMTRGADGTVGINGANEELNALLAEDPTLADTIANILDNNEHAMEFSASFEFANGSLSDSTATDLAVDKLEGIKVKLMGGFNKDTLEHEDGVLAELFAKVSQGSREGIDEQFLTLLKKGFSIRVSSGGDFEIVGAEDMDDSAKNSLKGLLQDAMDGWVEDAKYGRGNYGTGARMSSLGDVAEAFLEQHRFEDGDLDEFEHMVEIDFTSGGSGAYRVVSPEADAAQDEKSRQAADELGTALMGMLEEKGVDVRGLEMEIDENGNVTVLGDAADPNVRRARELVDAFVAEARGLARGEKKDGKKGDREEAGDVQAAGEAYREAQDVRSGEERDRLGHAGANGMGGVVARGAREENRVSALAESGKGEVIGRALYTFAKHDFSTQSGSCLNPVSNIVPEWSLFASGSASGAGGPGLRLADMKLGDSESHRLYAEYMAGMGQFHDDGRRSYTMGA